MVNTITEFLLMGFPGLQSWYYGPVAGLFLVVYLAILSGNGFLLVFVGTERSLQKPTYLIFCNLAISDIAFATTTLPKAIARYWVEDQIISFNGCFLQMFMVHLLGSINSFLLMIMALDRYIAICSPLRYQTLIKNSSVLILLAKACPLMMVIRAYPLPYCASNTIIQCYCDHISITTLACTDRTPYAFPAFVFAMVVLLVPLAFIVFSYCAIIVAVLRIASTQGRLKTLSTCTPQLIIIALYFFPRCFVYLASNVGITFSTDLRIAIIMLYSLLPPMVNPLIYCLRTKEVKQTLMKTFTKQQVDIQKINISALSK
uniref:Olfactory receptor n=1 Tax=Scleropages formosus TaxID=113540 RepID=A0A8C9UBS6_SCLFO